MTRALTAALAFLLLTAVAPARAGAVLDRIKREGIVRCAATDRPGYASIDGEKPEGRAADLCRAIAEAVLGKNGRFAFSLLDLDSDFDRVRSGEIELAFLAPRLVAEQNLNGILSPLAEAYRDRFAVMVPENATWRTLADLQGKTICFMIGDPVWSLLDQELKRRGVSFRPFGFSEEVEMKDAYNVGRCDAMAGLASTLGELRQDQGVNHLASRLLEEPLGPDPVLALVPRTDPDWIAAAGTALDRTRDRSAMTAVK